jgi:hypothetical protein
LLEGQNDGRIGLGFVRWGLLGCNDLSGCLNRGHVCCWCEGFILTVLFVAESSVGWEGTGELVMHMLDGGVFLKRDYAVWESILQDVPD